MAIKRTTKPSTSTNTQNVLKLMKAVTDLPVRVETMVSTINQDYLKIIKEVDDAKEDLSLGLDAYSMDIEEKKNELKKSLTDKSEQVQLEINSLEEKKKEHEKQYKREVEELQYTHKQNIERENESAWNSLADKLKKSKINKEEEDQVKTELSKLQKSFDDELTKKVGEVVLALRREVELEALKKDSDQRNELNRLTYELAQSNELKDSYKARMQELEAHVKEIPNMIEKAVSAASKPITVSTESKK